MMATMLLMCRHGAYLLYYGLSQQGRLLPVQFRRVLCLLAIAMHHCLARPCTPTLWPTCPLLELCMYGFGNSLALCRCTFLVLQPCLCGISNYTWFCADPARDRFAAADGESLGGNARQLDPRQQGHGRAHALRRAGHRQGLHCSLSRLLRV